MSELPDYDEVYLQVGRTLTSWNLVEHELVELLEYAHMIDGYIGPEASIAYWAVISFEARLSMCNAVVQFRTQDDEYTALREQWKSLFGKLKKKSSKRSEVAHGSVRLLPNKKGDLTACLIPYAGQKMNQFGKAPYDRRPSLEIHLKPLSLKDLRERQDSFDNLTKRIREFRIAWHDKDIEVGRHSPRH